MWGRKAKRIAELEARVEELSGHLPAIIEKLEGLNAEAYGMGLVAFAAQEANAKAKEQFEQMREYHNGRRTGMHS